MENRPSKCTLEKGCLTFCFAQLLRLWRIFRVANLLRSFPVRSDGENLGESISGELTIKVNTERKVSDFLIRPPPLTMVNITNGEPVAISRTPIIDWNTFPSDDDSLTSDSNASSGALLSDVRLYSSLGKTNDNTKDSSP